MDVSDTFTGEIVCPETLEKLISRLLYLHEKRRTQHKARRASVALDAAADGKISGARRKTLRRAERKKVLEATGKRCHICGGLIDDKQPWQADHVLAHSQGGAHSPENYLPAHGLCNHYRWDYLSEEFQWILKMGVWSRTLMQNSSPRGGLGRIMAERFFQYEKHREHRQKRHEPA